MRLFVGTAESGNQYLVVLKNAYYVFPVFAYGASMFQVPPVSEIYFKCYLNQMNQSSFLVTFTQNGFVTNFQMAYMVV